MSTNAQQSSGGKHAVNFANTLQNPGGNFQLALHKDEFPTQAFNSGEAAMFQDQFNSLLSNVNSSVIAEQLASRQNVIAKTATFAKAQFDNKVFAGINAGDNQIGFSVLRPGQIRSDPSTGNAVNDWYFTPSSAGWNDWIGNGSGNDYSVGTDQVSVVFGFVDQDVTSTVSNLNVQKFGRNMDMLPYPLQDAQIKDNTNSIIYQPLPTLIAQENDNVHIRLRNDRVAESQPRLLGVTFALGGFLNNEDY